MNSGSLRLKPRTSIRTKLMVSALITVVLALTVGLTVSLQYKNMGQAARTERFAHAVIRDVSDLNSLGYAYLLLQNRRAGMQWQLKHKSLGKLLSEHVAGTDEEQASIVRLRADHGRMKGLFDAVAGRVEERRAGAIGMSAPDDELNESLSALLMARSEEMINDASLLERESTQRMDDVRQRSLLLVLASAAALIISALFTSALLARSIGGPLRVLEKGAQQFAGGDLTYRVPVAGSDEIGHLSVAFNEMASGLAVSYNKLEREIGERKRAEAGLTELNETLEQRVAERTAQLGESEQRWATTLSSIGDAVIATDVAGRIVFMNSVSEAMTGWTLREASSKHVTEVFNIINEHSRSLVESPVTKVLREGMVVGLANHTILVRKDGTEVPIDDSGAPIRDAGGITTGVVLVFRDITERKQAEERTALLASYPQLNPSPVIEVNVSGEITFCNPATPRILKDMGLSGEECESFLPEDLHGILQSWDKLNESIHYREVSLKSRIFGETIHLVPQFGVARIYSQDITERKQAEAAIAYARVEAELRMADLEAVLDVAPATVWIAHDAECLRITGNRYADSIMNVPHGANTSFTAPPGDAIVTWRMFRDGVEMKPGELPAQKAAATGKPVAPEMIDLVFSDGHVVTLVLGAVPLFDADGRVRGSVVAGADVTLLKEAEEALRKAHGELELRVEERTAELKQAYDKLKEEAAGREQVEAQLRQAQKMEALGTLSGGIAHDFNNILAAIIGFTELVAGHAAPGSRDVRHLKRVMEASIRGRELVQQMLTFSRKTEQEKKPLALSSIVRETVKLLRASTPSTIDIKVNVKGASGLILGDPVQMQQVLMNLCTNAAFAMREKGGTLDIHLSDHNASPSDGDPHGMKPGQYVKLTVRDTGIGMPAHLVDKIFDPFFTTKQVGEGTGLGLSVVHGIVKQHEGYIIVASVPGEGSTFDLYLPKTTTDAESTPAIDDETPTGSERILFVDDEEALVEMGEDILAELGYEVTTRMNGHEALALLKEDPSRFDLVITDQTMPEMTGLELAREILSIRPRMHIIMCTGFSYVVDADKAREAGIETFAMKPLTKREIARTIRKVLDG